MLEIGGEKKASEFRRIPDNETVLGGAPGHDFIGRRVIHHFVGLEKERRGTGGSSAAAAAAAAAPRRSNFH